MTSFLLIRHASCAPVGVSLAGWTPGVHLDDAGAAQAERLGGALARVPIAAVYTSPLERARETATAVAAPHALIPVVCDALGELRFGDWTGQALASLAGDDRWRRFNAVRSLTRPPGAGELMLEVQARVVAALDEFRAAVGDRSCAIVSHADVIRAALAHFLGVPLDLSHRLAIDPASVTEVRISDWGAEAWFVNWTPDRFVSGAGAAAAAGPPRSRPAP